MANVPFVLPPDPWLGLVNIFRSNAAQLPASLQGLTAQGSPRICAELPGTFPIDLPLLQIMAVPGGETLVPLRLWTADFDLHIYDRSVFSAMTLARSVAALVRTFTQMYDAPANIGFSEIRAGVPFPLQDLDTKTERVILSISATYRPL